MTFNRFALLLAAALLAAGCGKQAKMNIACQVTPTRALHCKVQNLGPDAASVCFDTVVKCSMGDHTAKVCTSQIAPKKVETASVAELVPPVGLRETCYHAEIQNSKVF
jgi:hypothetical protein